MEMSHALTAEERALMDLEFKRLQGERSRALEAQRTAAAVQRIITCHGSHMAICPGLKHVCQADFCHPKSEADFIATGQLEGPPLVPLLYVCVYGAIHRCGSASCELMPYYPNKQSCPATQIHYSIFMGDKSEMPGMRDFTADNKARRAAIPSVIMRGKKRARAFLERQRQAHGSGIAIEGPDVIEEPGPDPDPDPQSMPSPSPSTPGNVGRWSRSRARINGPTDPTTGGTDPATIQRVIDAYREQRALHEAEKRAGLTMGVMGKPGRVMGPREMDMRRMRVQTLGQTLAPTLSPSTINQPMAAMGQRRTQAQPHPHSHSHSHPQRHHHTSRSTDDPFSGSGRDDQSSILVPGPESRRRAYGRNGRKSRRKKTGTQRLVRRDKVTSRRVGALGGSVATWTKEMGDIVTDLLFDPVPRRRINAHIKARRRDARHMAVQHYVKTCLARGVLVNRLRCRSISMDGGGAGAIAELYPILEPDGHLLGLIVAALMRLWRAAIESGWMDLHAGQVSVVSFTLGALYAQRTGIRDAQGRAVVPVNALLQRGLPDPDHVSEFGNHGKGSGSSSGGGGGGGGSGKGGGGSSSGGGRGKRARAPRLAERQAGMSRVYGSKMVKGSIAIVESIHRYFTMINGAGGGGGGGGGNSGDGKWSVAAAFAR